MTQQNRSPEPTQPARESGHPTVCGRLISPTTGDLCILRTGHDGGCERLRKATGAYNVVAFIEPSADDRCSFCYKTIKCGHWKLIIPETRTRYDGPLTICRTCAGDLGRHLLTFPTGPAPDPAESDEPDDWYPKTAREKQP